MGVSLALSLASIPFVVDRLSGGAISSAISGNKGEGITVGKSTAAKDKRIVTGQDIAKRNARAALVVGSPKGILSLEDQSATSGRGTLLGN